MRQEGNSRLSKEELSWVLVVGVLSTCGSLNPLPAQYLRHKHKFFHLALPELKWISLQKPNRDISPKTKWWLFLPHHRRGHPVVQSRRYQEAEWRCKGRWRRLQETRTHSLFRFPPHAMRVGTPWQLQHCWRRQQGGKGGEKWKPWLGWVVGRASQSSWGGPCLAREGGRPMQLFIAAFPAGGVVGWTKIFQVQIFKDMMFWRPSFLTNIFKVGRLNQSIFSIFTLPIAHQFGRV